MALACAPNQLFEVYTLGVIQEQRWCKYYYHPHRNHWNSKELLQGPPLYNYVKGGSS